MFHLIGCVRAWLQQSLLDLRQQILTWKSAMSEDVDMLSRGVSLHLRNPPQGLLPMKAIGLNLKQGWLCN